MAVASTMTIDLTPVSELQDIDIPVGSRVLMNYWGGMSPETRGTFEGLFKEQKEDIGWNSLTFIKTAPDEIIAEVWSAGFTDLDSLIAWGSKVLDAKLNLGAEYDDDGDAYGTMSIVGHIELTEEQKLFAEEMLEDSVRRSQQARVQALEARKKRFLLEAESLGYKVVEKKNEEEPSEDSNS